MIDRENAVLMKFNELYGASEGVGLARAPGRVNIIGEHTDYNEGYVLPIAIGRDTMVAFKPSGTATVRVHSMAKDESASFPLDEPVAPPGRPWAAYVAGVARALQEEGLKLAGVDLVVHSTVPIGGGLSSSAALEVSTALGFLSAAGIEVEKKRLARICQRAENEHVGMRCGIMDQYVALFGEEGAAVRIDCRSVRHEIVPFATEAVKVVVCDTGVRHELASSEYNRRRADCERAAKEAGAVLRSESVRALRDVTTDDLPALEAELEPVLYRRLRHVVTENARVLDAVRAMRRQNYVSLGVMMDASHESLRDDYEVSCKELDAMVEIAWSHPGVYGSRMTGGGFGGCTVTVIASEKVDSFCRAMATGYTARTGIAPNVYVCGPERGAEVIRAAS